MRLKGLGVVLFVAGLAGLGLVSLVAGGFAYLWEPTPAWLARMPLFGRASGALLFLTGLGVLVAPVRARASLALILQALASIVLVHVSRVLTKPQDIGEWFGLGEVATIAAGALLLFVDAAPARAAGERGVRLARALFAVSLPIFGISHFIYAKETAGMVPAWLPGHLAWASLTGVAHIAAGVAMLVGVLPRLAATLEAIMVTVFLLTVNAPQLARAPSSRWQWTELFVASTLAGAAFLVASSYRGGMRSGTRALQRRRG